MSERFVSGELVRMRALNADDYATVVFKEYIGDGMAVVGICGDELEVCVAELSKEKV